MANGTSVKLEKDPARANNSVDSDKDGIPDIIELNKLGIIRSYDNKRKRFVETKVWFYYSNPSLKDTDGDTIGDIDDLRPTRYDTVVVSENDNHIKFNTGRTWHIITCKSYTICDIYTTLTAAVKAGAVIIALIVTAYVTAYVAPVVAANLEALDYYVSTYGVKQGLNMYCYLGVKNVPDGVITWLQMDMEDGQSSIDDLVDARIPIYKRGIYGENALREDHPGGISQKYFTTFVNGKKGGRYIDLYVRQGGIDYIIHK